MTLEACPFPSSKYIRAVQLAAPFNQLVEAVASQPAWLLDTLQSVEATDTFTARLMALMREVMARGESQRIHLGLHRSDYMLHLPAPGAEVGLLQVELNTIAASFASISTKATELHKFVLARSPPALLGTVPENDAAKGLARALVFAHRQYLKVRPHAATSGTATGPTGAPAEVPLAAPHEVRVLFVVQPGERNTVDQRGLEYEVAEQSNAVGGAGGLPGGVSAGSQRVLCLRASLRDVASRATVVTVAASALPPGPGGEGSDDGAYGGASATVDLLYLDGFEISVVYFRAGYSRRLREGPRAGGWVGRSMGRAWPHCSIAIVPPPFFSSDFLPPWPLSFAPLLFTMLNAKVRPNGLPQ